jgi:hypothetical protein
VNKFGKCFIEEEDLKNISENLMCLGQLKTKGRWAESIIEGRKMSRTLYALYEKCEGLDKLG